MSTRSIRFRLIAWYAGLLTGVFLLLSGLMFDLSSMPRVLQFVSYAVPARYFITVVRGVFLKGVGLDALWPDMLGMAVLGVGLLSISIARFKKSLD